MGPNHGQRQPRGGPNHRMKLCGGMTSRNRLNRDGCRYHALTFMIRDHANTAPHGTDPTMNTPDSDNLLIPFLPADV